MRKTQEEILENVGSQVKDSRFIRRNTLSIRYTNGNRAIRFHETDIVTIYPDGSFKLDSNGWRTRVTQARLNDFMPQGTVFNFKGRWFLMCGGPDDPYVFEDGMVVEMKRHGMVSGVSYPEDKKKGGK